jgi:hypothetical protein
MAKKMKDLINDYNGKFEKLERTFPEVTKRLLKGDYVDRFLNGVNSVGRIRQNGKDFLFLETPGHGWILDMSGKVVGEEDCGFFDEKMNINIQMVFSGMERLF